MLIFLFNIGLVNRKIIVYDLNSWLDYCNEEWGQNRIRAFMTTILRIGKILNSATMAIIWHKKMINYLAQQENFFLAITTLPNRPLGALCTEVIYNLQLSLRLSLKNPLKLKSALGNKSLPCSIRWNCLI